MTLDRTVPRGKFISKKVSKIRWQPLSSMGGQALGTLFMTGSWDDEANAVELWSYNEGHDEPVSLLAKYNHGHGDVNDLRFLGSDAAAVVASSSGTLTVLRAHRQAATEWTLEPIRTWERLHSHG